jgi:SAM-dependent methyltransferase
VRAFLGRLGIGKAFRALARPIGHIRRRRAFEREWAQFRRASGESESKDRFRLERWDWKPCLYDKTAETEFDAHYVYHTAWAARKLRESGPERHVDISSSLYFCAIVSAFVPVDFYDFRPAPLKLQGLQSKAGNIVSLGLDSDSVVSLSCMHVVEHIGLGRYGDSIAPEGDKRAAYELARVLAPAGSLLFVVPMAETAYIAYNAHRVYSFKEALSLFPGLELLEFVLIPDDAARRGMIMNAAEADLVGQRYACGCFQFRKPAMGY